MKVIRSILLVLMLPILAVGALPLHQAAAVSASSWRAGNIMDDGIFTDRKSMSVSKIQSWLDARLVNCDYNGTKRSELSGGKDYDGNGTITRAEWARANGYPTKFTCLNMYYEVPKTTPTTGIPKNNYASSTKPSGSKSAAQLIYDASQAYSISPKVLLVKLATESAGPLTSDVWPLHNQYTYAMGARCPDSGPGGSANCDTKYAGFSIQMREAAKLLRGYLDNMDESWWSFKKPYKTNTVLWNVQEANYKNSKGNWVACGGSDVYIQTKATAALYTYTPYQPNSAALDNMYTAVPSGTGFGSRCAAYGNRNFWRVFYDWFGSTRNPGEAAISIRYNELSASAKSSLGTARSGIICGLANGGCYQKYTSGGAIVWTSATGAWESYGQTRDRWSATGNQDGMLGYPVGRVICGIKDNGCYQRYQGGYIIGSNASGYWESTNRIRDRWSELGFENGTLGYPIGPERATGDGGWYQKYRSGYIIGNRSTGYWESTGPIRERWTQLGNQVGELGYPTGPVRCGIKNNGCFQRYGNNAILWSNSTGAWESKG